MRQSSHIVEEIPQRLAPKAWDEITRQFEMADPPATRAFLRSNPTLVPLLRASPGEIRNIFGNSTRILLSISQDQELPEWRQLDVEICTSLAAKQATKLLAQLDGVWGVACTSASQGQICFLLRPE